MQLAYLLNGGTPVIKKYKMAAAMAEGIIVLGPAAGATGLSTSTTTSWANSAGLTVDGGILSQGVPRTYSTTQGDPEYISSVIINPDAILRALMVGSAANAVLTENVVATASSNGLTAVGGDSMSNLDEGYIWYTTGANAGKSRRITSVSTVTATVIMPFAANAVGDKFLAINATPTATGFTLSTDLKNVLQSNTALTGTTGVCVDIETNGAGDSYLQLVQQDHAFTNIGA